MKFLKTYFNLKSLGVLIVYVVLGYISLNIAYLIRFDFNIPDEYLQNFYASYWWMILVQVAFLFAFDQFNSVLSQFKLPDLFRLFISLFISALYVIFLWYWFGGDNIPPRSIIVTNLLIYFMSISACRIFLRIYYGEGFAKWWVGGDELYNAAIVGAGEVGSAICADILSKQKKLGFKPVIFLDDSKEKIGRFMHGLPIVDEVDAIERVIDRYSLKKVILAFPSASSKRIRSVADKAQSLGLKVDIVPALTDLVSGKATMTQIRPVELEDLLGRETVDLNFDNISKMITNQRVLITGAGGSIGQELLRQISGYNPESVLCLDKSEIAIFDLNFSIIQNSPIKDRLKSRVIDITQEGFLEYQFKEFNPTIIFHAAAHKHVNLMEEQPKEALRNNFFATINLMQLSSKYNVDKFIFISTDKAVNPTSVMGVTKRLAEIALQSHQKKIGNKTSFMAVRFGNVLGSSGSVVNIFKRQIANGGPLTVTDPEVTRFFMTIRESIGLILEASTQGKGGEIFVLDMGEPVKILDVAKKMISLSGFKEGEDIDIEYIGLQAGEKLYEEVQHLNEVHAETDHPRIFSFTTKPLEIDISTMVEKINSVSKVDNHQVLKNTIKEIVPEYHPSF